MSVKTGLPGPWLQPSEYGRNEAGQFATLPYEDVDPDKINALAAQFDARGFKYRVTHNFGKHRLEVFLSYNPDVAQEVPVDLWEYNAMTSQKDLLAASNLPSGISQFLIPPNVKIIRDALNGVLAFDPTATHNDLVPADFFGIPDVQQASYAIYLLMKTGYDSTIENVPVLRHSQSVSHIYPITLSKLNVGRIITTSTLLSLENPPSWALTGLPTDAPKTINGIVIGFGWYKCAPSIQQIAGQKWQIIQEFQYGAWPFVTMGVNGAFL